MDKSHDSVDVIKREFAQTLPGVDVGAAAVTGRIRRTSFYLNRNAEEVFSAFNTTGAAFDVLAALYALGSPYQMTPTELYRGHMMSSAGVTARLDVVERAGLAARSRDPRDRRGVIVTLTRPGQKLVRDAAQALYRRQAVLLNVYTVRERKQLLSLLKRLLNSLERLGSGTTLPDYDAASAPWVREFPSLDPWLIEFLLVIAMLTGRINRETDRLLHGVDLSRNALTTLAALRRSGDSQRLLPRELSQAALLSSAGMTSQLDQLEDRGLVRRSPHPEDRRAIYVTLTRPGQKLVDKAIETYNAGHKRMLAGLSSGERQTLDALLRKLLVFLEASNGSKTGRSHDRAGSRAMAG
ncbi:MAG TPA: MarR family transcriptional regulator [Candidatus Dormibacteraeota bacterium]|nr:MarR family transcriptional regulator [Candidatus Dormibacteraeota bacterium]